MHRGFVAPLLLAIPVTIAIRELGQSPTQLVIAKSLSETQACEGIVNGTKYPFLVPAHLVWGELWSRADVARANANGRAQLLAEVRVEPRVLDQILSIAAARASGAFAIPEAPQTSTQDRRVEEVLAARDALVRTVGAEQSAGLSAAVKSIAVKPYRLGVQGTSIRLEDGRHVCKVSIDGKKLPHLIPEHEYWGMYFRSLSNAAAEKRNDAGEYKSSFIQTLQARHLPISEHEILTVLTVAIDVTAKVRSLDEGGSDVNHLARLEQISAAILSGRDHLLRTLDVRSWEVLRKDAQRIRGGTVFDYPGI